jgi:hypothetical protein
VPISPRRSALSEHTAEPIPLGTLGYIRARAKRAMFSLLIEEFKKSGISKARLARRLNMDPALVSRLLGTPANWRFETICDLLFGISGAVPRPEVTYPLSKRSDISKPAAKSRVGEITQSVTEITKAGMMVEFNLNHIKSEDLISISGTNVFQFPLTAA